MQKQILFLDTETTSKDNGRLVQLAFKVLREDCREFYFKPGEPISFEAMAVHHITEADVANLPTLEESGFKDQLQKILNESIVVAHNAKFDVAVLERDGLKVPNYIDTLKVARHLLPDMPNHQLQYLRYALGLKVDKTAVAHSAAGDVLALEALFNYLFEEYETEAEKNGTPIEEDDQIYVGMLQLSARPTLLTRINFGKHAGKKIEDIKRDDRQYLEWLAAKSDLDEDLKFSLDYYLKK